MKEIIDYSRSELIDLIRNSYPAIEEQYNLINNLSILCKHYNKYLDQQKKLKKRTPCTIIITLILCLFVLLLLLSSNIREIEIPIIYEIIFVAILYLPIAVIPIVHFCTQASNNKNINQSNMKINEVCQSIHNLQNHSSALQIIPFRYQTPIAAHEIVQYLENYRANNWTEAVNILEDTIHKNYMVHLQSGQIASLNKQLNVLKDINKNAGTSGLDVVIAIAGLFA